jgi:hypothetical protein
VNQATLTISGTTATSVTGFDGQYSTGWATAGTYQVTVSAPGYLPATVSGVLLQNGQTSLLDVQLVPLVSFTLNGAVVEQGTGVPVAGATVTFTDPTYNFTATTNGDGTFTLPAMYPGVYQALAGRWGWHTVCLPAAQYDVSSPAVTIELPSGYADDFALDLGWTANGDATSGPWQRGEPVGTTYQGSPCAPDEDVAGDCSGSAYVTGNGGGQAGDDDVDGGAVVLASPEFDVSAMPEPWVRYHRWFFNAGGNSAPDDQLVVQLANAVDTVTIETVTAADAGAHTWVLRQFALVDVIGTALPLRIIVRAADGGNGHLVEAALDRFEVLPQSPFLGMPDAALDRGPEVFPVPSDGRFTVRLADAAPGAVRLLDLQGRQIDAPVSLNAGTATFDVELSPGMYALRVELGDGSLWSRRIILR